MKTITQVPSTDQHGPIASQCAIVIPTCDSYSETWEPFDILFERYWPDCPFPAYLVANEESLRSKRIRSINVGPDISWTDTLLQGLEHISEPYVILMVDDLFLTQPVDTARIQAILEWLDGAKANCVHLHGRPRPATRTTSLVGLLPPGTYYRSSAVNSLWRKNVLTKVLQSGETAWDFEILGSQRSNEFEGFYSSLVPCFFFINALIKGKWHPRAVATLRKLGVSPDCRKRGLMDWKRRAIYRLAWFRAQALRMFPLESRGRIKSFIRGKKYKYRLYSS